MSQRRALIRTQDTKQSFRNSILAFSCWRLRKGVQRVALLACVDAGGGGRGCGKDSPCLVRAIEHFAYQFALDAGHSYTWRRCVVRRRLQRVRLADRWELFPSTMRGILNCSLSN